MGKINDLKDQALATLNGKWGSFVGLTFIYLLIYSLCCFLAMFGTIFEGSSFTGLAVTFSFIGSILMVLLIPMGYGYMVAYLHSSRQDLPAEIGDLFFGFRKGQFARVLGAFILLWLILMVTMIPYIAFIGIMAVRGQMEDHFGLTVFIAILLMIPMYVVALAYALVPFLLRDEPELSAREILAKSRMMMQGHKWELFILMLSFIGWSFLCVFTLFIGYLWLAPYMCMTFTKYYEKLRAEYEGVADEGTEQQPVVEEPASVAEEPAPAEDNE